MQAGESCILRAYKTALACVYLSLLAVGAKKCAKTIGDRPFN